MNLGHPLRCSTAKLQKPWPCFFRPRRNKTEVRCASLPRAESLSPREFHHLNQWFKVAYFASAPAEDA